jgi:hypothetical protein
MKTLTQFLNEAYSILETTVDDEIHQFHVVGKSGKKHHFSVGIHDDGSHDKYAEREGKQHKVGVLLYHHHPDMAGHPDYVGKFKVSDLHRAKKESETIAKDYVAGKYNSEKWKYD